MKLKQILNEVLLEVKGLNLEQPHSKLSINKRVSDKTKNIVDYVGIMDGIEELICQTDPSFKRDYRGNVIILTKEDKYQKWIINISGNNKRVKIESKYKMKSQPTYSKNGLTFNKSNNGIETISSPEEDKEFKAVRNFSYFISTDPNREEVDYKKFLNKIKKAIDGFPEDY